MAKAIPDRWLKYKPIGQKIEGTRFIAFKVPLRERTIASVSEHLRLDAQSLLKNVPNLGLIIDLTNTNRYYDPTDFESRGVLHMKLMIPGHVTPSNTLVNKFKYYVTSFLNSNKHNDKLIGVHCTHGVNRTGYLICNYMISEMQFEPREAIKRFDYARGHHIERTNYLNALAKLHSVNMPREDEITDANKGCSRSEQANVLKKHHSVKMPRKDKRNNANWRCNRSEQANYSYALDKDCSLKMPKEDNRNNANSRFYRSEHVNNSYRPEHVNNSYAYRNCNPDLPQHSRYRQSTEYAYNINYRTHVNTARPFHNNPYHQLMEGQYNQDPYNGRRNY